MSARERMLAWTPPALFAVLALVAHRALLPALGSALYHQPMLGDDSLLHVWVLAWGQHALWTQPAQPFDGNIFWPHTGTALYTDHLLALAALLAPLRLVTDDVVLLHNLVIVAAFTLNAWVAYALAHDLTRSRPAALVAGIVYGFSPMRLAFDRAQIQMVVAWWMPLVLLAGRRALTTGRWGPALVAGGALAIQGWTAIYLLAFFAPFVALAHLGWLRSHPMRRHARAWGRLLAAEAVGALLVLPSLAAYQSVQATLGSRRSVVANALLGVHWIHLDTLPWRTGLLLAAACLLGWRRLPPWVRRGVGLYALIAVGAFLLSLGPVVPLPGGGVRGPYAALMALPGYDALRAPGRFLHVALLGLAVVAAGGVVVLARSLPTAGRRVAALGIAGLLAFECLTPRYPVAPVPRPQAMHPVYAWLAEQPAPMRLVEIPFGESLLAEQRYQYASTAHWHPIVNGNMGVGPPLHAYLVRRFRDAPLEQVLAELAALGVTHVVVHERRLAPALAAAIGGVVRAPSPRLRERQRVADAVVYELVAPPAPERRAAAAPLPRTRWRIGASENATEAGRAIDGRTDSGWSSWGELERGLAAWWQPGWFLPRWWAFIERQPTRLELDLGSVRTLESVELVLAGSDPMVLMLLTLETSFDGRHWVRAPATMAARPDAPSLVAHAPVMRVGFDFDRPVEARRLRLACHGLEWRVTDLDVRGR